MNFQLKVFYFRASGIWRESGAARLHSSARAHILWILIDMQACSHMHSFYSFLELHKGFGCSRLPRVHMIVHTDKRLAKYEIVCSDRTGKHAHIHTFHLLPVTEFTTTLLWTRTRTLTQYKRQKKYFIGLTHAH